MPWSAPSGMPRVSHAQSRREYDRRRRADPALANAARIRSGARWQRCREQILVEHPLCLPCQEAGRTTLAVEVDHIEPLHLFPELAYMASNLQPICRPCHAAKSARERAELRWRRR